MSTLLTKQQVGALLGRSLSSVEDTNFDLYLKIATERLQDLLCTTLTTPMSDGLALLLARCFGVISSEQSQTANLGISTKKVEDFSVSFRDGGSQPMQAFVDQNANELERYSECQARIRQGKVPHDDSVRLLWLR